MEGITIEKNGNTDIVVAVSEYKGKTYLNIRECYIEARTGQRKPTRKGVTLEVDLATDLLQAITKTLGSEANKKKAEPDTVEHAPATVDAKPTPAKASRKKPAKKN
jgi:hypothetical protein